MQDKALAALLICVGEKKKKTQVILSALCPLLCNSTRPQHTLQMFADHCGPRQTIPWETINQGLLQPQGELYPIQTIFNHRSRDQLLEFRTSFYETISSEFLVQGNFKHTQFSREHWHWRDSNSQPHAPKASAVLTELTWLPTLTGGGVLTLTWYTYTCLSLGVLFQEFWYNDQEFSSQTKAPIGCILSKLR